MSQPNQDITGRSRMLRGGAFYYYPYGVRVATRLRDSPDFRNYGGGFRVVVSPSSLTDETMNDDSINENSKEIKVEKYKTDFYSLPIDNNFGFVEIPEGSFLMGSDPEKDKELFEDELPQSNVYLPTYWIAKFVVTNQQYNEYLKDTGKTGRGKMGDDMHPVVNVSWHDANVYCKWLNQKIKQYAIENNLDTPIFQGIIDGTLDVQLPSEEEWEKAARGTDGRIYPWGNEYQKNACNDWNAGLKGTCPVDAYGEYVSPYGVYNMAGNVWEWTRSVYAPYPR